MKVKNIKNGLQSLVQEVAEAKQENFLMYTAPLQNMFSSDYNLRKNLYTYRWTQLSMRYATDGIFKTLVQQPVLDALRNGIKIISEQLGQEDIEVLEQRLIKKDIIKKVKDTFIWNRLFGGAGLIIEVAGQKTDEELSLKYIDQNSEINYYSVNRWELSNTSIETGNKIADNQFAKADDTIFYFGNKISRSKILLLKGVEAPYYIKQLLMGWGLSVCEPLVAPSNAYQKSMNLIYELIDESKIDVYSISGLKETLAANQQNIVVDQIQLTNLLKNYQNALVLDSEDKYEQKQLNLSGIVEIIRELKLDICSAVKIPAVILWGMSPSGFSSGEFDLKSYYGNIESELRPEIKQFLLKILKIECKNLFGFIPDDLDLEFYPLLIQTETEVQTAKDREFARIKMMYDSKLLTKKEFFEALKQNNIFTNKTLASEENEYTEQQNFEDFDKLDL